MIKLKDACPMKYAKQGIYINNLYLRKLKLKNISMSLEFTVFKVNQAFPFIFPTLLSQQR